MGTFGHPPDAARSRDVALVIVAAFELAMSITFVWLGMRAVMSIGGACAEGGPFVPARPCPDGVPAAMVFLSRATWSTASNAWPRSAGAAT